MCGEQEQPQPVGASNQGSPPRVRGTASQTDAKSKLFGITPACAGNSDFAKGFRRKSKDHPRVCGEQVPSLLCPKQQRGSPPRVRGTAAACWHSRLFAGSPPRVRGTVQATDIASVRARITPACAGNRLIRCERVKFAWDHPRVCGEQKKLSVVFPINAGSPPRVRGTDNSRHRILAPGRITPACAGNRMGK